MKKEMHHEAYQLLRKNLTDRNFLSLISHTKKSMNEIIKEGDWLAKIESIFQDETISCLKVAQACAYLSDSQDMPRDREWLHYVYNFTLSQLFPTNFISISNSSFEEMRLFYSTVLRTFLTIEGKYQAFLTNTHFEFFHPKEAMDQTIREEYTTFLKVCDELYLYEFLRISREATPFDTLGHVASVHYIAEIGRAHV